MMNKKFEKYLINLGFSIKNISENQAGDIFNYTLNEKTHPFQIKYILTPSNNDIFNYHKFLWNKNMDHAFIAVGSDKSHLINVKNKPDYENTLKPDICIKTFNYGINSESFKDVDIEQLKKDYIDSAYFFDFIRKKQIKKLEVDKDLLLNLSALRKNLINSKNENIVNLLILRCLFVKYLEDRDIFKPDFLMSILKTDKPANLIKAFDEVCKINGDIFGNNRFTEKDITTKYLKELALFFECDYRTGQGTLFPYCFDQIPIQLISHVYEAFLKTNLKRSNGVYYTPLFLVDFMLSQSLKEKIKKNKKITIFDPAVGSGAFLVESFKKIEESYGKNISFEEKKKILETQLFGIDVDENALQITAFSLYLSLLETEPADFIRKEIEQSHPILPSLLGKTLIKSNTLTEEPFSNCFFDFIISNPPWGSVSSSDDEIDATKEREAIDNRNGCFPEYIYVADYERSQAFLMRVERWCHDKTTCLMIVKNSIFLNDKAKDFRTDLLNKYYISKFYELSHYNKILFKKKEISDKFGNTIEIGATEPCVVLLFQKKKGTDGVVKYTSPKLTKFAEHFELIHISENDTYEINQSFFKDDLLWKILVNGDIETYRLINSKVYPQQNIKIEARSGFQPKLNMTSLGEPIWKKIITPSDFEQYTLKNKALNKFNWNQTLRRKTDEKNFKGIRIIAPVRPLKSDKLLIRGLLLNENIIHKDDILSIKFHDNGTYIKNYPSYLALLNSSLIGFYFYHTSTQWGKGDGKRDTLRNTDLEKLPIKKIDARRGEELQQIVNDIISLKKKQYDTSKLENKANDIIFDIYELLDNEKEIIREFYQINVERNDKSNIWVTRDDLKRYFEKFKDVFSFVLSKDNTLNASYYISLNIGAVICITINDRNIAAELEEKKELDILNLVKSRQLESASAYKVLSEEKVKIYNEKCFYIIKSNYFKDWTVRQAIKDAKEEISLILSELPDTNE